VWGVNANSGFAVRHWQAKAHLKQHAFRHVWCYGPADQGVNRLTTMDRSTFGGQIKRAEPTQMADKANPGRPRTFPHASSAVVALAKSAERFVQDFNREWTRIPIHFFPRIARINADTYLQMNAPT
jgi:hypothetical protein